MKSRKQFEKWGVLVLAGLCVFLVFRLVSEIMGSPASAADPEETISQPSAPTVVHADTGGGKLQTSAKSDPELQVPPLEDFASTPLPDISRNPFDFGTPPVTPAQRAAAAAKAMGAMTASSAPAPPRVPFQAIGYTVKTGVGPEAFLADSNQVYIVRSGEVISHRYKVLRITPSMVEVQDGASGEKAQLPIPQVQ